MVAQPTPFARVSEPRAAPPSHNLPAQPTPLLGRDHDLAALATRLRDPAVRLLTLTGPPGTGKTRLAVAIAERALRPGGFETHPYPDGVWFVALEAAREPEAVAGAIAQTLGVRAAGAEPLAASLARDLAAKRLLLLLDNFEQALPAAPLVAQLLAACPGLKALVTSRAPLRLRWEREAPVLPLALPDPARADDLATVAASSAVQLFVERAGAALPDFRLTTENAGAVAEICRRLDGLPLAIELAAARIKLLPPAALRDRLEQRLSLLTGGPRDLPARHQTLRAALAWSHDLLDPAEQRLFRRLSVFAGRCGIEAAEAVCADPRRLRSESGPLPHGRGSLIQPPLGRSTDGADGGHERGGSLRLGSPSLKGGGRARSGGDGGLEALASLLDHALLRREEAPDGEPHYRLLETVREYAAEQLAASPDAEAARNRHAAWFLALAEQAEKALRGPAQAEWLARLAAEHDNVRAALDWLLESGDATMALRIGGALWRSWEMRGHFSEGRRWLDRALAAGGGAPAGVRAKALNGAGCLAQDQGDYPRATALLEQSLHLRQDAGDDSGVASVLNNLALVAVAQGDLARGRALHEECLAILRSLDDRGRIGRSLNNLALVVHQEGNDARAMALLQESLALARELGDTWEVAARLGNLGEFARRQGDLTRAAALLGESTVLFRGLGDKRRLAECLEEFAALAIAQARPERAARLSGAAEALRDALGTPAEPIEQAAQHATIAAARAALGEPSFATTWAVGRSLSPEKAVTEALAGKDEGGGRRDEAVTSVAASSLLPPPSSLPTSLPTSLPSGLTAREAEVLGLIAAGQTNREIAEALVVTVGTVERHIANLYAKIGARGRADATTFALRHNLLPERR